MPAKNSNLPHNRDRLIAWLETNPGFWRPMQIADALGVTVHRERLRVYNELARLAREGKAMRHDAAPPLGKVRPIPLYSAAVVRQGGRRPK